MLNVARVARAAFVSALLLAIPAVAGADEEALDLFDPMPPQHVTAERYTILRGFARGRTGEELGFARGRTQRLASLIRQGVSNFRMRFVIDPGGELARSRVIALRMQLACLCLHGFRTITFHGFGTQGSEAYLSIAWDGTITRPTNITAYLTVFQGNDVIEVMATEMTYQGDRLYIRRVTPLMVNRPRERTRPSRPRMKAHAARAAGSRRPRATDSSDRIDLLVAYTSDVLDEVSGNEGSIRAKARNGACMMTNALRKSGVKTRICIVGYHHLEWEEDGAGQSDLLDKTLIDASLVQARFDAKADVVSTFVMDSPMNQYGMAEIWAAGESPFQESAYSVVSWLNFEGGLAFAHEIAHNFGCQHQLDDETPLDAWSHAHDWSHEESTINNDGTKYTRLKYYKTILGHSPMGFTYSVVRRYSNPDESSPVGGGVPLGVAGISNNARTIRDRLSIIANWGNGLVMPSP